MSRTVAGVLPDRLRHLKEVLDISNHQSEQWVHFYGAVIAAMKLLPSNRVEAREPALSSYPSLPLTIDIQFRQNLVRLEACRALRGHVAELYSVLSDKQRVLADRLLVPILVAVMDSKQSAAVPLAA
jgi:hypothetical protein